MKAAITYPHDPAHLVKQVRISKGLNQQDFGKSFNKSQGEISRYESGEVEPPLKVVMYCMHELGLIDNPKPEITAKELARLVEQRLKGAKHIVTRKLLVELIERLT